MYVSVCAQCVVYIHACTHIGLYVCTMRVRVCVVCVLCVCFDLNNKVT